MMAAENTGDGSYLLPRAEHARVVDAMRHGLLKCPADATPRDAARMMCTKHVHMVAVTDAVDGSVIGALTDLGLVDALLDETVAEQSLAECISPEVKTVSSDAPLLEAARLMRDSGSAHVLVSDAHNGHPVGVLSTLDVAGILAWGEA